MSDLQKVLIQVGAICVFALIVTFVLTNYTDWDPHLQLSIASSIIPIGIAALVISRTKGGPP